MFYIRISICFIMIVNLTSFTISIMENIQEPSLYLFQYMVRDNTHMTSMKIIQLSRVPTALLHLRPKFSTPLTLDVQFQMNPPSPHLQVITNQLKENIIQESLLYVIRSFLQVGFHFQYQLINPVWLSFRLSGFPFDFFSPYMRTNEIKTRIKPSHVIFKLITRSIVRFSPQTMQGYHYH